MLQRFQQLCGLDLIPLTTINPYISFSKDQFEIQFNFQNFSNIMRLTQTFFPLNASPGDPPAWPFFATRPNGDSVACHFGGTVRLLSRSQFLLPHLDFYLDFHFRFCLCYLLGFISLMSDTESSNTTHEAILHNLSGVNALQLKIDLILDLLRQLVTQPGPVGVDTSLAPIPGDSSRSDGQ